MNFSQKSEGYNSLFYKIFVAMLKMTNGEKLCFAVVSVCRKGYKHFSAEYLRILKICRKKRFFIN